MLVVMHINYQLHVQLQLDSLLVFASVSVLNGWDCMHAHNDMHAAAFPCMRSTTMLTMSPCLLHASCWDGSITCMGAVSSASDVAPPIVPIPGTTHLLVCVAHVLP